jgi:uncharacterized protein (PEP-CTERM system associated)
MLKAMGFVGILGTPLLVHGQVQTPPPAEPQPRVQPLSFEPSISGELIISDNGNFGIAPGQKSEVTAVVTPSLGFRRDSPNLRLNGSIGLSAYTYANNTQEDTVLPRVDVALLGTMIRDVLTVDASVRTRDFLLSPLSAENAGGIAQSRFNAIQTRVAPTLGYDFGPAVRFEATSDNSLTTYAGDSAAGLVDGYVGLHSVSLVQRPQPFGWSVRAERSDTKYDVITLDRFTTDIARVGVEYLFNNELSVGVTGGRERNRFPLFSADGSIAGINLRWRPVPATSIYAETEKRFFGNTWSMDLQYRTPIFAVNARASRDIETFQQELLSLPRRGTVAVLIDEVLIGRIPDPIQRAQAIQDLINRRALPSQIDQATAVYSERVQIVRNARVSAAIIGARNSIVLTVFQDRTGDVPEFDNELARAGLQTQSVKRIGASAAWNHRLSSVSGLDAEIATVNSTREELIAGKAKQSRVQIIYSRSFSPRSVGAVGYRFQRYALDGSDPDRENAVFATLTIRF